MVFISLFYYFADFPTVGHEGRDNEDKDDEEGDVVAVLEHDQGILLQVGHVDSAAGRRHGRVLPHQQPAHVGEEEASVDVVRVGVGLAPLVVDPVVPGPGVDRGLAGQAVAHQQDI